MSALAGGSWGGQRGAGRGGDESGRDRRLLSVDVEFVLEFVEPAGLAEFLDAFAEVVLAQTDLDVVLLDCDGGFPVAVVTVHTPPTR